MAIYTVGRRRVIVALLLSAALLLTLDLRGNPVLDTVRDGFVRAMSPVERATDVVATPVQRAWNSYDNYDDLERENEALQEQIDRLVGTQAAAEAAVIDYNLLLALNNLPSLSSITTEKAQVIGGASNNIDQIVEINKGSDQGIEVGMPVVNQAGLIGKITQVNTTTSKVMLITDPRFSVAVEILGGTGDGDDLGVEVEPTNTTPSGRTPDQNDDLTEPPPETTPSSTTPLDVFGDEPVLPQSEPDAPIFVPGSEPVASDVPVGSDTAETSETNDVAGDIPTSTDPSTDQAVDPDGEPIFTTTTTTVPVVIEPEQLEKEFGVLQGRGQGRPAKIEFLQDNPSLAVLEIGDLVETAGGSKSLAPPNIPVGRVINRADRPGVAGPLLEIQLNADLDKLNFVRVVLFRPLSEVSE